MSIRNYPDLPRIYLDMDGVVADFEKAMQKYKMTPHELKMTPGAYINLEPIDDAIWGVHQLIEMKAFFLMMLTKIPSKNPYAASEKLFWMQRELPIMKDHIIITPDKGCSGTKHDFLVDDHPEWANASNFPGTVIKFGGEPLNWLDGTSGQVNQCYARGYAYNWVALVEFFKQRLARIPSNV